MTVFPLVLSCFLTFGYVPTMESSDNGSAIYLEASRAATFAELGLALSTNDEVFTVYGDVTSYQYLPRDGASISPFMFGYSFGAQVKLSEHFRINLDHSREQPTGSYSDVLTPYEHTAEKTTISVTISAKTKFGGNR